MGRWGVVQQGSVAALQWEIQVVVKLLVGSFLLLGDPMFNEPPVSVSPFLWKITSYLVKLGVVA